MLVAREADIQQAEIFHALLAQRRAVICDLLDEQAIQLGRAERRQDTAGVRRKRLLIKEIGAELREIDRMMLGLTRLAGVEQPSGPSACPDWQTLGVGSRSSTTPDRHGEGDPVQMPRNTA